MSNTDLTFLLLLVPIAVLALVDIGLISVVLAIWDWVSRK